MSDIDVATGFSTREVAEVLGLSPSRIQAWARQGLLRPHRTAGEGYRFSFQDVALLRAARALLDDDVPVRTVGRTLKHLREQLPSERPLSAVGMSARGRRVVVTDQGRTWDPDSDQLELDVEGGPPEALPPAGKPAPPVETLHPERTADGPTADDWYDAGVDLEDGSPDRAKAAYRKALELDPAHPDAHLNLGRLLHEEGALDEAERHYRSALSTDPESARAFFNLGVALEDKDRPGGAVEAYEAAVRLDPELAVAHFNLSRILERMGRRADALKHLAAYRRLLDGSGREAWPG